MSHLTRASEISRLVFMIAKNISNERGTVSRGTYFGHVVKKPIVYEIFYPSPRRKKHDQNTSPLEPFHFYLKHFFLS